jgi:N-acetylglucosamine transport system substrate-binding protein
MKKLLGILLAIALLTSVLAACANDSAPSGTAPQTPPEQAPSGNDPAPPAGGGDQTGDDANVLNIAIFEGGFGPDFWLEVVSLFEADNPGVTVNMQISPEIGDIIRPQIVAGNVPDFLNLNVNDQTGIIQNLIQERGLLDITDVFDGPQYDSSETVRSKIIDGFLQSALCAPYGDGRIFLAPSNAGPVGHG